MLKLAPMLVLVGCFGSLDFHPSKGTPPSIGPAPPATWNNCARQHPVPPPTLPSTAGDRGVLVFTLDSVIDAETSTPIAVGAEVDVSVQAAGDWFTTPPVKTLATAQPDLIDVFVSNGASWSAAWTLAARAAGQTKLIAFDATGTIVDETTINAADVNGLEFANGWGAAPGPTVVTGIAERYWVRLLHDGAPLAGNRATRFTYEGPIEGTGEDAVPSESLPDTEENFAVGIAPGAASITAHSGPGGSVSATLLITLVDPSAVNGAQVYEHPPADASGCVEAVDVTALADGTPVYGPVCVWQLPSNVGVLFDTPFPYDDEGGWPGDSAARHYLFAGAPGPVRATCKLAPTGSFDIGLSIPAQ